MRESFNPGRVGFFEFRDFFGRHGLQFLEKVDSPRGVSYYFIAGRFFPEGSDVNEAVHAIHFNTHDCAKNKQFIIYESLLNIRFLIFIIYESLLDIRFLIIKILL